MAAIQPAFIEEVGITVVLHRIAKFPNTCIRFPYGHLYLVQYIAYPFR